LAYRYGLNEGDQLISVNGVDFRTINHFEAVKLFKESIEFLIVAKYSPYGNFSLFTWEYFNKFVLVLIILKFLFSRL
jgi:hypothetical protein